MSLLRWDPFSDFGMLRDAVDRLFEDRFAVPTGYYASRQPTVRALPLDMWETKDAVIVKAPVPGLKPEDVDISIDQGLLTIRGRIPSIVEKDEAKDYNWYLHEIGHGEFARSVSLPTAVDANKAEATYENGVLTLTVPKAEEAKPRQIKVRASSAIEAPKS